MNILYFRLMILASVNIKKHKLFITIWAILFALAFLLFFKHDFSNHNKNAETFKKVLTEKEKIAKQLIDTEKSILSQKGISGLHQHENERYLSDISNDNIYFACYKNDSAVFWSNGDFLPIVFPKRNIENTKIIFINDTWTYIIAEQVNNYVLLAFVPIKKEYPFENNYLKNYYFKDFNVSYNYSFSLLPQSPAYYITDSDDEFLFSIQPQKPLIPKFLNYFFLLILSTIFLLIQAAILLKKSLKSILFSLIGLLLLRISMMIQQSPAFLFDMPIFNAEVFASKGLFSSLGDTFFNSWLILLFVEWTLTAIYRRLLNRKWLYFVWMISIFILIYTWIVLWNKLVFQSNLSFDLFNIDVFWQPSILAFLILGIWSWIIARGLYVLVIFGLRFTWKINNYIILFLLLFSVIILLAYNNYLHVSFILILFYVLLVYFINKKNKFKIILLLLSAIVFSTFIVTYSFNLSHLKKKNLQQVVAFSLANEKDIVAQMLMSDIDKKLAEDKILQNLLQKAYDNRYEIYQYLKDNYFYGFWNKYDIQVTICNPYDNLRIMPSNENCNCFDYFNKLIKAKGSLFDSRYFYSIDNDYGEVSYLGVFSYPFNMLPDSNEKRMFIELYRKFLPNTLGYPDLLMDAKTHKSLSNQWDTYAKYKSGRLIQQSGNFNYTYAYLFPKIPPTTSVYIKNNHYEHFIYAPNEKLNIVVSSPIVLWNQYVWSIIYLFNLFVLIFFIPYGIYFYFKNRHDFLYGFRFKYIRSFLGILIFSYIIIGFYTIIYFNNQYQEKNLKALDLKRKTIINGLNEYLGSYAKINQKTNEELNRQLVMLSNIFYADINIFNSRGHLKATSRPALFEKGIKGPLIDAEAFSAIVHDHKESFIDVEHVGNLEYISSYTALYSDGKLQAIVQLPYFTEKEKNKKEILQVVLNLINIYTLFIAIAFGIILLIANGILKPLTLLQDYFKKIKPNQKITPITYHQKDEIAPLINEYNRILEELSFSTQKLLNSEREAAWRDVAKQIAHEIKNPLTPMKLNIQYLLKIKNEQGKVSDEILKNTMQSLLEQIDSLSTIATAFSTFANLPKPHFEQINLNDIITKTAILFHSPDCFIETFLPPYPCFIDGDKEYVKRILTNLITNAIQAIPTERKKKISIYLEHKYDLVILSISDNGIGISPEIEDKIFKPSFTTKSSGMGMGLSLVKNMVEAMNGKIFFTTKINIGTTFYVEFNCINNYHEYN